MQSHEFSYFARMQTLRRLLLPFSFLYGLFIRSRNLLFDKGFIRQATFPVPVISVGNLTTGGTGKTPHVEYLIRLLREKYRLATLSRGYGRRTTGFLIASGPSNTHIIGDEPMQYYSKFSDLTVAVSSSRVEGIENLLRLESKPEVILLDDAFQHRYVKPGLSILLKEYDSVMKRDFLLPAGNLREPLSSARRADIIIISKCPSILVPIERKRILENISVHENQHVFFSYVSYGEFSKVFGPQSPLLMSASYYMEKRFTILLVTGIAKPAGMIEFLRRHTDKLETVIFPDHHEFTDDDVRKIRETFDNIANKSKIIVTTEKDAMRLRNPALNPDVQKLPWFYLPIETRFHQEEEKFNSLIETYVAENKGNH